MCTLVVNGTCEADWASVTALCQRHSATCVASYGLHPWRVRDRSPAWAELLERLLRAHPRAAVGEAGLHVGGSDDKAELDVQSAALRTQLRLAASLQRPVSLHCVGAVARLYDDLLACATPGGYPAGLLLHGFSGGADWVPRFESLGAYFSFSAANTRPKTAALLRAVSDSRLLLETDAPDGLPRGAELPDMRYAPPASQPLELHIAGCSCAGKGCSRATLMRLNAPVCFVSALSSLRHDSAMRRHVRIAGQLAGNSSLGRQVPWRDA